MLLWLPLSARICKAAIPNTPRLKTKRDTNISINVAPLECRGLLLRAKAGFFNIYRCGCVYGAGQVAAMLVGVLIEILPALFKTKSRALLSLVNDDDVLQSRILPAKKPPVIVLGCPSAANDTYGRLPFITIPVGSAGPLDSIVSPVSTFALLPLLVVSIKTIHPCSQFPVVVHCVPLVLIQTVTRLPILTAFVRA